MKCCFCDKRISDRVSLVPIEKKGTKNRKWACLDCKPKNIIIDEEVKEIASIFDKKFI